MTCESVEQELVAYHFGSVAPETRSGIEHHLLGCTQCLRSFLAIKSDIELGDTDLEPSRGARERLRAAIAERLRPEGRRGDRGSVRSRSPLPVQR